MAAAAILKNRKIAVVTFLYSLNILKQYMYTVSQKTTLFWLAITSTCIDRF